MEQFSFGDYITQEYGLLKQILSYLPISDLRNAKYVCKKWSSAVELLLDKNPTTLSCPVGKCTFSLALPRPILSSVIVIQNPDSSEKCTRPCSNCRKNFAICPCLYSDHNTAFVALSCPSTQPRAAQHHYSFWQTFSALLMPSSEKCKVSTFYADRRSPFFKQSVGEEVIRHCVGEEPIKGLFVITTVSKSDWVNKLCNGICNRQKMPFAIGGGIFNGSLLKIGFKFTKDSKWKKPGVILISFRGEAVSVLSDVLTSTRQPGINTFMEELANRAGPVSPGGSRVAFIAQCIDRVDKTLEMWEIEAFQKAFPSVPQFGFHAYGEYGISSRSTSEFGDVNTLKRKKLNFEHVHTTSFLIVTFSKI